MSTKLPVSEAQPDSLPAQEPSLFEIARGGNNSALGKLLEGYREYLILIANRGLDDELRRKVSASDLVQETVAEAAQGFSQFAGSNESQLAGWLRQILVNNLADAVAKFRKTAKRDISRERAIDDIDWAKEHGKAMVYPDVTPGTLLVADESRTMLLKALDRLSEKHRQVITLRNFELLNFVQISELIGCSADSARKMWDRAIRRLTHELVQYNGTQREPASRSPGDDAPDVG